MTNDAAQALANGIVEQAVTDYMDVFMGVEIDEKPLAYSMKELNQFFESDWYSELTSVDSVWLRKKAQIKALDDEIEAYQTWLESPLKVTVKIVVPKAKGTAGLNRFIKPRLLDGFRKLIKRQMKKLIKERDQIIEEMEETA